MSRSLPEPQAPPQSRGDATDASLPSDIEALKAILLAERQAYRLGLRDQALLIEKLKQKIAKLKHDQFGQSSERRALLDQLSCNCFRSRKI